MGRARPMHVCGRQVVQRLVWTFKVVKANVVGQLAISLLGAGILMQINFLVLDGTPQSFCEDVVSGASASIHTDFYLFALQAFQIFRAGEVTALIAVPDFRLGLEQGLVHGA